MLADIVKNLNPLENYNTSAQSGATDNSFLQKLFMSSKLGRNYYQAKSAQEDLRNREILQQRLPEIIGNSDLGSALRQISALDPSFIDDYVNYEAETPTRNANLALLNAQIEQAKRPAAPTKLQLQQSYINEQLQKGTITPVQADNLRRLALDLSKEDMPLSPEGKKALDVKKGFLTEDQASEGPELKEFQAKATGFYERMKESGKIINGLEESGIDPITEFSDFLTGIPSFGLGGAAGNALLALSPEKQKYKNAAMNWVRANLRKESGAVIGEEEAKQEYATYFPVTGDSKEVIAQKAQLRKVTEDAMKTQAGKGVKKKRLKYNPQTGNLE